jgi:hypothetical protein
MKEGWRMSVYKWIVVTVFNHPCDRALPWYLYWLKAVFFPIDFFCWTQKTLRYDYANNSVWIDGKEYDRFFFNMFKEGNIFKIISTEDGLITCKILTDEFYMEKQNEYNIRKPKS